MLIKSVLFLMFVCFSFSSHSSTVEIKAIVNNEVITSYDISQRLKLSKELLKLNNKSVDISILEKSILPRLIDEKIKKAEAIKYRISVTQQEIDEAIKNMEKSLNLPNGKYVEVMTSNGFDKQLYQSQIESDIIWMKFMYTILRGYVKVTDAEINLMIENMKNDNNFKYETVPLILDNAKKQTILKDVKNISSCDEFIKFASKNGKEGSGNKTSLTDNQMHENIYNLFIKSDLNKPLNPINVNGNDIIFFICEKEKYIPEISTEEKEAFKFSVLQGKLEAYANKYFEKMKASSIIDIKEN